MFMKSRETQSSRQPAKLDGTRRMAELPLSDRPRERLSILGAAPLSDRELLAMVLNTGGRGAGAHVLAEQLLARFGSLFYLARAHHADLMAVPGVGPAKASAIVSTFELARRLPTRVREPRPVLTSTKDLHEVVRPYLSGRTRERMVLVVCDGMYRVTSCEVLAEGSADRAIVPVREILVAVLRRDGRAFALAHNHPDDIPEPSDTDIEATRRVRFAADGAGLDFLQHIVVTDHTYRGVPVLT
jgi:DNA repair protein RadC